MSVIVIMLAFTLVLSHGVWGSESSESLAQARPDLLRDLKQNITYVGMRPVTYELLGLLAVTPAIASAETNGAYRGWLDNPSIDHVFEFGELLGNGGVNLAGALGLYFAGRSLHRQDIAALGSDLTSGVLISGSLAIALKMATARTRPDGSPYSFPSGHATMAFTTAGVIANRYGLVPGLIAEAGAAYVGMSRLQENKHFITDVVAGSVLGNFIAYEVVNRRLAKDRILLSISSTDRRTIASFGIRF